MGKTIGLISLKGGVGKTTLSCALAADLSSRHNQKVLLIDTNYSAPNLGIHMNILSPKKTIHDVLAGGERLIDVVHDQYGIDVIPGNFLFNREFSPLKLRNKISTLKHAYDFIILDGSPSLNDEVLSTILASDLLFVVSTPDYPTLSCTMKAVRLAKQRDQPIHGIILNRVKKRKYSVRTDEVQQSCGIPVIAQIKEDDIAQMALHERVPATLFAKDTAFSKEIHNLSRALTGKNEKNLKWRKLFGINLKHQHVNREILRRQLHNERKK